MKCLDDTSFLSERRRKLVFKTAFKPKLHLVEPAGFWSFREAGAGATSSVQRLLGHRAVCSPQPTPQGVFQDPAASGTVWDAVAPTKLPFVRACSVAELCLTLCKSMDYRPPGSSVHVISQARMLEWVAISFSRGSSQPRDWINIS